MWLLEELVHSIPSDIDVYVMYDIACTLTHLKTSKNGGHLLERIKFALPSFHAIGYVADCQVQGDCVHVDGANSFCIVGCLWSSSLQGYRIV